MIIKPVFRYSNSFSQQEVLQPKRCVNLLFSSVPSFTDLANQKVDSAITKNAFNPRNLCSRLLPPPPKKNTIITLQKAKH
jgi:hypothetical protein